MRKTITLFLLKTASTSTSADPSQHSPPNPAACSAMSTIQLSINELNTYPTESDVYMAEAQALAVDRDLQCPTTNGMLDSDSPAASDICKNNQELKDAISGLKYTSSEDKRLRVKGLIAACRELAKMLEFFTKEKESI